MAASFRKKASFKPLYFTDSDENDDPTQSSQIRDTNVGNSGDALSMKNSQTSKKKFTFPESSTFDKVAMLKKCTFSGSSERGVDGLKKPSLARNRDVGVNDDAGKKPMCKEKRKRQRTACIEEDSCETVALQKQKLPRKIGDSMHVKKDFPKVVESRKITKVKISKRNCKTTVKNESSKTCSRTSFKKTSKKILLHPLCTSSQPKGIAESKLINASAFKHLLEVVNPGQDTKGKFPHNVSDIEETSDSDDYQCPQRLFEKGNRFSGKFVTRNSSKKFNILSGWEELVSLSEESLTSRKKFLDSAKETVRMVENSLKLQCQYLDEAKRNRLEFPLPGRDTVYHRMLEDSLNGFKEAVSRTKETLARKKKDVKLAEEGVHQVEAVLKSNLEFLEESRNRIKKFRTMCGETT